MTVAGRDPAHAPPGVRFVPFPDAADAIGKASHLLSTVPPDAAGDPVLVCHAATIRAAGSLAWIGYLSTTGVYGDRGGGWVDEDTAPAPSCARAERRLAAERAWQEVAAGRALDIFRLAGIYGLGRSAFDALRSGTARRIAKPGHEFGRIHRDDIVAAVLTAMWQERPAGPRILNLSDDAPAEPAAVIEEAARLLDVSPPPPVPFEVARETMGPMARSFWAEDRKVSSRKTQAALGLAWRYPSFREGLRAILAVELSGA